MATPTKRAPRKTTAKKAVRKRIAVEDTEEVDIKTLRMYYKNPNVGNPDKIAVSLHLNGQYKPITVNRGTHTGRPNEILAGNHTYLAARKDVHFEWTDQDGKKHQDHKPSWDTLLVSWVDYDEGKAAEVVAGDNHLAELAERDAEKLAEVMQLVTVPEAMGYSPDEIDDILERSRVETKTLLQGIEEGIDADLEDIATAERRKTFMGSDLGDEDDTDDSPVTKVGALEAASDEIKGGWDLKDELPDEPEFRTGYWGIPALRPDRLMTFDDIPDDLETWAGSATKDWPHDDQWWFYNYGIDSSSGMKDVSRVIVAFYTWDEYFEKFFWKPKPYTVKILNSGIKYILTPNYSMWPTQSQTLNLFALYRARWVGRYFQEAGLKVCPDINWPMGDLGFLEKYVLATLPKGLPLISMQMQTFDQKQVDADPTAKQAYQLVLDTLQPQGLLLYAGKPGREWFRKNIKYKGKVFSLETRNSKLSEKAKEREKKTTI